MENSLEVLSNAWLSALLVTELQEFGRHTDLSTRCVREAIGAWFDHLRQRGVPFQPRHTIHGAIQEYVDRLREAGLLDQELRWLCRGTPIWGVITTATPVRSDRPCLAASWSFPIEDKRLPEVKGEVVFEVADCLFRLACQSVARRGFAVQTCVRAMELIKASEELAGLEADYRLERFGDVCHFVIGSKAST